MRYFAKVISLNNDFDEEVVLSFGRAELLCFINDCDYAISQGNIYLVDIDMTFLDTVSAELSLDGGGNIKRMNDLFSYEISGFLSGCKFFSENIVFQNDLFKENIPYDNQYITLYPDRISVSFL
ncbi:hypothetical protein JHU04_004388 [Brenneria sp. 4F2]|nr:hypothetical protein [Brenneria bubanii]